LEEKDEKSFKAIFATFFTAFFSTSLVSVDANEAFSIFHLENEKKNEEEGKQEGNADLHE
jgi:hypothetical protein